jgi:hypothetical protein
MDGADHVSSVPEAIGRLRMLDLENERSTLYHVI